MTEETLYRFLHFYPQTMLATDDHHSPNEMYNYFAFHIDPTYDNRGYPVLTYSPSFAPDF